MLNKAPSFWYKSKYNFPNPFFIPISEIVGLLLFIRKVIKRKIFIDFPSVGVGSLALGGAHKTTISLTIAEKIRENKKRVGVVVSGYGGKFQGTLIPQEKNTNQNLKDISDEALLYLKNNFPVSINKNRKKGADELKGMADLVILDDFFSSLYEPWIKIISITKNSMGNELIQPFGPLREPIISLLWSDMILLEENIRNSKYERKIRRIFPRKKDVFYFSVDVKEILHFDGEAIRELDQEQIRNKKAICISAVAIPKNFEETLKKIGVRVYEHFKLKDHSKIPRKILDKAEEKLKKKDADIIITTEKDFWKIIESIKNPPEILGVKIRAKMGDDFFKKIECMLNQSR
ncbi:Tetraacyldisaccharide 4'-kinase [bacterium HR19]|nr:Tetraacyldisaccharide 4'-kinase [bacterium HR19]